jgi:hypothetical protein
MQPEASAYGPKGQENIAQALAHARQHKEVTAKDAEGCFSAVPACPPWSRESETKEERSRLIASGSLRHVELKAAKHH